jgi:hypothetical protein
MGYVYSHACIPIPMRALQLWRLRGSLHICSEITCARSNTSPTCFRYGHLFQASSAREHHHDIKPNPTPQRGRHTLCNTLAISAHTHPHDAYAKITRALPHSCVVQISNRRLWQSASGVESPESPRVRPAPSQQQTSRFPRPDLRAGAS